MGVHQHKMIIKTNKSRSKTNDIGAFEWRTGADFQNSYNSDVDELDQLQFIHRKN